MFESRDAENIESVFDVQHPLSISAGCMDRSFVSVEVGVVIFRLHAPVTED